MIRIPEFAAPVVPASVITAAIACSFGKPGLSTKRAIDADEVEELAAELKTAKRRVRVYSQWGFVPNSYRNRCTIQYVEAKLSNGVWVISTGWCGVQRSGGSASRVVVQ